MHIIVFGRGKMAKHFSDRWEKSWKDQFELTVVNELPLPDTSQFVDPIVIHVSSGKQLPALIVECEQKNLPLIQASSGQKLPENLRTLVVNAPNLALPIIALFDVLPRFGFLMQRLGAAVMVTESHQSTKTSAPITAHNIAANFGLKPESVNSIRNQTMQLDKLNVPVEYLDGHAYHFVEIEVQGVVVNLSTKIHGRDAYIYGAISVARLIFAKSGSLGYGVYELPELMFNFRS